MQVNISLDRLKIADSKYYCGQDLTWPGENIQNKKLERSFKTAGIVMPLLVQIDKNGDFHLVDGYRRVAFALVRGLKSLPSLALDSELTAAMILRIVFWEQKDNILRSAIEKSKFIHKAVQLDIDEKTIINELLPIVELRDHKENLKICKTISSLPASIQSFCSLKKFSLKQCTWLSSLSLDLIQNLLSHQHLLNLSASNFMELLELMSDELRANNLTPVELLLESEVSAILRNSQSSNDRTETLKHYFKEKRQPTLNRINREIEKISEELSRTTGMKLRWDTSLEKKEIEVSLRCSSVDDLPTLLQTFQKNEVKESIGSILDRL